MVDQDLDQITLHPTVFLTVECITATTQDQDQGLTTLDQTQDHNMQYPILDYTLLYYLASLLLVFTLERIHGNHLFC